MPRGRKKKQNHFKHYMDAWVILCGVFLVASGVVIFAHRSFTLEFSKANDSIQNLSIPKDMRAWVEVDFGAGNKRVFEGDATEPPQTLTSVLETLEKGGELTVTLRNGVISELGGRRRGTNVWRIYKNGAQTLESPDVLTVGRSDYYTLIYGR